MGTKIAFQTDDQGFYVGQVPCQESPLEPGIFLIPRGATEIMPPTNLPSGMIQKFDFQEMKWNVVENPAVVAKRLEEEAKKAQEEAAKIKATEEETSPFSLLSPGDRQLFILQVRDERLRLEVDTAFQRFTWHDWNGTPLDMEWKKEWAEYRKALLSLPILDFDFSSLEDADDFPWPKAPIIPPDLS